MKKGSRILLIVVSAVAIVLLGVVFTRNLIDFPVYYAAGRSLISGRADLYSPDFALGSVMDYRYPPFFLIILYPLWLVPYSAAAYIWFTISAIEVACAVLIVIRTFPALRKTKTLALLVVLAVAQHFVMVLHYGNAHLLVVALMFGSFYCVLWKKDLAGGLLMALAITIKVTPVLLLPYFVLKRRWKLLLAVGVFLVVLNLVPSAYFGFRANNELLATWYRHVVTSQEFHEDNGPINLSIKGQLRRYLSAVDYSQRVNGDVKYPAINLASLSREQIVGSWATISAGLFAGVLLLIWRYPTNPHGVVPQSDLGRRRLAHEFSLMVCLMLLVGPLTSKIYFIALLWPVACLASLAIDSNAREGRVAMRALIVVAFINSVLPLLPGRSIQRLLLVLGVDFYLNCLVMAVLTFVLVSQARVSLKRSGEPRMPVPSEARTP
jgi:hypothetical protein